MNIVYKVLVGFSEEEGFETQKIVASHAVVCEKTGDLCFSTEKGLVRYNKRYWKKYEPVSSRGPG